MEKMLNMEIYSIDCQRMTFKFIKGEKMKRNILVILSTDETNKKAMNISAFCFLMPALLLFKKN